MVGRKKREPTRPLSIRLPNRMWGLIKQAADERDVTVNRLVWSLIEDFLVRHKYMKKADRKRLPIK